MFQTLQQYNKYNDDEKLYDNQFLFDANKTISTTRTRTRTSEKFFSSVLGIKREREVVYRLIPIMRQWEMKDLTKEIIV